MLKGLLTRQIFMLVDLALAVLTVFVAYQVFTKLFQSPVSNVVQTGAAPDVATPTLATVGPRDNFNVIVESRLFGPVGEARQAEKPVETPITTVEEDSEFAAVLKLKGTSFTKVRPNALIERQGVGAKVYEKGEEVIEGQARLDEVHNRWVYLFNIKKNQREILRMDEDMDLASTAKPEEAPTAKADDGAASKGASIKRDELQQELQAMTENITELVSTTNPRPVTGPDGKVVGFTADNLGTMPLAQRLGFKDGDVVKEINGMPVDSMESITNAIEKYQDASNFHITVLRNGTPTLLKFKLE